MKNANNRRRVLETALREGRVVPVIGPEALSVVLEDGSVGLFYDFVVMQLLADHEVELPQISTYTTGSPWILHRATTEVFTKTGLTGEMLRRSVSSAVRRVGERVTETPLLSRLARIGCFDLFVSLTPDDFLCNALRKLAGELQVGVYAPDASSSIQVDVPRAGRRVFFPFGRIVGSTRMAIHEEDALEYLFKFQEEGVRRAPNFLVDIRGRDLLFVGCDLPDWLGRGFLRLVNADRLSSADRKVEFFGADSRDPALNSFLARFSPNSCVFPWSPQELVAELELLAPVTGSAAAAPALPMAPAASDPRRAGGGPTAFVSYASENLEAALRIAQVLPALGFSDVWFDKRKLIAGDDWSHQIDHAIRSCDFFVPILSKEADRRREGVFWEEWRQAFARALRVNDSFLLPIGIDDERPNQVAYDRIYNGFTRDFDRIQTIHAPAGSLSENDQAALRKRCAAFARLPT